MSKFLQGLKSGGAPSVKREEKNVDSTKPKEPKKKQKKAKSKDADIVEEKTETAPAPILTPTVTGVKIAGKGKLIFSTNPHWYTALPPLPPSPKPTATPTASQISSLTDKASALLSSDAATYQASSAFTGNSASDSHFLNTILSKGTLSDRLSALTLLVQASPLHNAKALETLKGMSERGRGKGGREEGLKAMRCVVDWWTGGGAPGRKLKWVEARNIIREIN